MMQVPEPSADVGTIPALDTMDIEAPANAGLSPDDESNLQSYIERWLQVARSDENKPQDKAVAWRKYVSMQPSEKTPYEGAPNITTPVIREKVDGIRAHISAALTSAKPFVVAKPRTPEAQRAFSAVEQLVNVLITETESDEEMMKAVADAIEVGTGHVKHVLLLDDEGNRFPASRFVPFEDIFVVPSTNVRPEERAYFERFRETRATIYQKGEDGIYRKEKVRALLGVDKDDGSDPDMYELETIWEVWLRWKGDFWQVFYSEDAGILAYQKSDWASTIGRAPYDRVVIEQSQTNYWGRSIAEILEGLQRVSDAAINSELVRAQYEMAPVWVVNRNSPVYRELRRSGIPTPGSILGGSSQPSEDIYRLMGQMNPISVQLMEVASKMAESATISDMLVPGQPTGGRKTATEVNMVTNIGALKLRNYLHSVAVSLQRHIAAKWRLIHRYFDERLGVVGVDDFAFIINGRETVPERQMRLQHIQYLLNPAFIQFMQAAMGGDTYMQAIVEALFEYLDMQGLGGIFREAVQRGQNAQQVPGGNVAMAQ